MGEGVDINNLVRTARDTRRGFFASLAIGVVGALLVVSLSLPAVAVNAQGPAVNEIDLDTAALVYDSHTDRIYASVPASSALHPNSIVVINPNSATIESNVEVGSDPGLMAISDDGEWLYVFLGDPSEMLRLHVPTMTVDIRFKVGEEPGFDPQDPATPFVATDFAVLPGQPEAVAVVSHPPNSTGPHLLAVYSNGSPLPDAIPNAGDVVIEFGEDSTRLYAFTPRSNLALLKRFEVNAAGVTFLDETEGVLESGRSLVDIEYDAGFLYSTSGKVVDGEVPEEVGSFFSIVLPLFRGTILVEPSSTENVTYYIRDPELTGLDVELQTFDQTTTNQRSTHPIAGSDGVPSHLIGIGPKKLAYRTTAGQVFLIDVQPGGRFIDDDGNIFEQDIEAIAAAGVTKGCNPPANDRFCPSDNVTRETMAAFIVRALGLTDANHPGFKDVAEGSTFENDIKKLAKAGITRGCNPPANDLFCPKDVVSRETMAAFMVRALGLKDGDHPGFDDVSVGNIFGADIKKLAKAGITKGCNPPTNTRFCPKAPVTRGAMAAFMNRAGWGN